MFKILSLCVIVASLQLVCGQGQWHPSIVNRCASLPTTADTFIANYFDCAGYYICRNRVPLGFGSCSTGLYFNNGNCDFSHNVECLQCDETVADTELHLRPIPGLCNEYALCFNRVASKRVCAENFVFHATDMQCVPNDPLLSVPVCAACPDIQSPSFIVKAPVIGSCDEYLLCTFNSPPAPSRCTEPLVFDSETRRCVPASEATCEFPSLTACRPDEVHYVPSADSCEEYFVCFLGVLSPTPLNCPTGLSFDINTFTCRSVIPGETQCFV